MNLWIYDICGHATQDPQTNVQALKPRLEASQAPAPVHGRVRHPYAAAPAANTTAPAAVAQERRGPGRGRQAPPPAPRRPHKRGRHHHPPTAAAPVLSAAGIPVSAVSVADGRTTSVRDYAGSVVFVIVHGKCEGWVAADSGGCRSGGDADVGLRAGAGPAAKVGLELARDLRFFFRRCGGFEFDVGRQQSERE